MVAPREGRVSRNLERIEMEGDADTSRPARGV